MEIGKTYEVIFAELENGGYEKEEMKLLEIKNYKNREIYIFEESTGHVLVQYDHGENVDWEFVNEINDLYGE